MSRPDQQTRGAFVRLRPFGAIALPLAMLLIFACEQAPADRAVEPGPDTTAAPDRPPAPTSTADSLRAALGALVRGELSDSSWFSPATASALRAIDVDARGHAIVDFDDLRDVIPNASSSAGSEMLLRELNDAVFDVPGVTSVEYRMNGDCEQFGEWLQFGLCIAFTKPQ